MTIMTPHDNHPDFTRIITSSFTLPEKLPVNSLYDLVFGTYPTEELEQPLILGHVQDRYCEISRVELQILCASLIRQFRDIDIESGDTVALIRLSRNSETLISIIFTALTIMGVRTLLPMYADLDRIEEWFRLTGVKSVIWSPRETLELAVSSRQHHQVTKMRNIIRKCRLSSVCIYDDLQLPALLEKTTSQAHVRNISLDEIRRAGPPHSESLILTTSGTSGEAKLVSYTERAFLTSCLSWQVTGLFDERRFGGRGLIILFAHSMGVRAFWNALWVRRPACIISPEWYFEKPELTRSFLLRMKPQHITGGPAAFRALLELARIFPDVKNDCLNNLRCAVSSGARFDPHLASRLKNELGVELHNAFGTTETQQVLSTLLHTGKALPDAEHLGEPLAGVSIGLKAVEPESSLFQLFINSPFGFSRYLNSSTDSKTKGWFDTGDLVISTDRVIKFAERDAPEIIKDAFGVKVSLWRLHQDYSSLSHLVDHIEFFPLQEEPGIGVLFFSQAQTDSNELKRRLKAELQVINDRLFSKYDDMECRHLTVSRFLLVSQTAPRTLKGTVSRQKIKEQYYDDISLLTGPYVKNSQLVTIDRTNLERSDFTTFSAPHIGEILRIFKLDKEYFSGQGDYLYYWAKKGEKRKVADCVGGYGATLLGHRHPELVRIASEFFSFNPAVSMLDQGSVRAHTATLAKRLSEIVGRYTGKAFIVKFGSTGAEAVEMALTHALLEWKNKFNRFNRELQQSWGSRFPHLVASCIKQNTHRLHSVKPCVLALKKGFHGNTIGSRSLLSNKKKRKDFTSSFPFEPIFLDHDRTFDMERVMEKNTLDLMTLEVIDGKAEIVAAPFCKIIAAIAEPILGEGGIHPVSQELLQQLARSPWPLIIDEIQTGMGRTGSFLASQPISGDYYLFSKSLGGGMAKISALLVDRNRYVDRFDELYSSTFAGDTFSSVIAESVLDIIAGDELTRRALTQGEKLFTKLQSLREAFPDVIAEVRGRGLMLGIELDCRIMERSLMFRLLIDNDVYGLAASSYLLNNHHVRVLPTLTAPNTLRIEPSAFIEDQTIDEIVTAFTRLCEVVRTRDLSRFLGALVAEYEQPGLEVQSQASHHTIDCSLQPPVADARRVAFISHFVYPERELTMAEPSLQHISAAGRRALFSKLTKMSEAKPVVAFSRNLFDERLWFCFILLPIDAATLQYLHRAGDRIKMIERIQEAVNYAHTQGCSIVSLGGFASILTKDGTAIHPPGSMYVSTGNGFTVAVAVRQIIDAAEHENIALDSLSTTVAVLGASGNIGSAITRHLFVKTNGQCKFLLIAKNIPRLELLKADLQVNFPTIFSSERVSISSDLSSLRLADIIVVATNSNDPLIYPHNLDVDKKIIIADVSVPSAVSPSVRSSEKLRIHYLAAAVSVPGEPNFTMSSHTPPGTAFCCAAEAMILGLSDRMHLNGLSLTGTLDEKTVAFLERQGEQFGFLEQITYGGFTPQQKR